MILDGCGALVTGCASGLGRATAAALRGRGAKVVGVDLAAAIDRAEPLTGVRVMAADVRDAGAIEAAVEAAAEGGGLRVCVSCAGVGAPRRILRDGEPMPLEDFARAVGINL